MTQLDAAALHRLLADLKTALKAIIEHEEIDGVGIRYTFDYHSPLGRQARAALAKADDLAAVLSQLPREKETKEEEDHTRMETMDIGSDSLTAPTD